MQSTKILLGSGILSWGAEERRTNRYGSISLADTNYYGSVSIPSKIYKESISYFDGKRVTLEALVTQTRLSGHVGDLFLGISPETPELGEIIRIGTGVLFAEKIDWGVGLAIGLRPQDGRNELWLDPRILYRLHDQSIELCAALTDEPDHIAPDLRPIHDKGAISNEY